LNIEGADNDIYVAKPWNLRKTPFDGLELPDENGKLTTFAYTDVQARTLTTDQTVESQVIEPRYIPKQTVDVSDPDGGEDVATDFTGSQITVQRVAFGPGVSFTGSGSFEVEVEFEDMNRAARSWKSSSADRRARITASEATSTIDTNSNPVQWKYKIQEIANTSAGYGGATSLAGGHVSATFDAYNHAETGNDGTGRQMNGIDHDGADYPATFKMQPLQVNAVVKFEYVRVNDELTEVWLWPPGYNGEDGTC